MGCEAVWKLQVSLRCRVPRSAVVSEFRETRGRGAEIAWSPVDGDAAIALDAIDAKTTHGSMSTQVRAPNRHGVKERAARSTDGAVLGDVSEGRGAVGEESAAASPGDRLWRQVRSL